MKSLFVSIRQRRTARLRWQRCEERSHQIILYLMDQEWNAELLEEQDHYAFCRKVVSMALDGWAEPYVAAFYYHYGRHPKKLIPEWLARDEKTRCLEIPDYDPTIELRIPPPRLGLMSQMSASGWPDQQDSLRNPQEAECASQPQIPRPIPKRRAGTDSSGWITGWIMCSECAAATAVVPSQSRNSLSARRSRSIRSLCALHLERARETSNRHYERKRLALGKTVQHLKGWKGWQNQPAPCTGFYGS